MGVVSVPPGGDVREYRGSTTIQSQVHRLKPIKPDDGPSGDIKGRLGPGCKAGRLWWVLACSASLLARQAEPSTKPAENPPPAKSGGRANELAVPDYLGFRPAGAVNRRSAANVPNAGVAGEFSQLQGMGGTGPMGGVVPYLGGGGGAGMIPPGLGVSWGSGMVSFSSGVSFMWTDNALQSSGGASWDLMITPMLGMDVAQQVTEYSQLTLSLGVGYRYSLNYTDLAQINLLPMGSVNYSIVVGDVLVTAFNRVASPPTLRQEVAGNQLPSAVDFNRIQNQTGISAAWALGPDTSVSAMYGYTFDKGLSDQYAILDSGAHTGTAGVFQRLTEMWSVGVSGSVTKQTFSQNFQNGTMSYGAGPVVSFRPNQFIAASAGVQYTIATFDSSGSIADTTEFSGFTWQGSISHQLSERITHAVMFSSGVNSGLGSNFTESTTVGYTLAWRFMERMGLNAGFDYTNFKQSSRSDTLIIVATPQGLFGVPVTIVANDEATMYNFTVGTGYQISDRITTALSYAHSVRDSRFAGRSFSANSVTLVVNFRF